MLEEAAEAVDAMRSGNGAELAEELGDVLLQVAFHAVIAEEAGEFSYETIEEAIVEKLIRRHPHVFADASVENADQVVTNWQQIKAAEKSVKVSPAERVPRSLPALMRAQALGKELGWQEGSPEQIEATLKTGGEASHRIGALLLAVVDHARALGVDPELALREAVEARARQAEGEPAHE